MQIWECIKAVNYGRIDFSPDAKEKKQRVIELPDSIEPDDIIKTHFKLASEHIPVVVKAKPINDTINELVGMHDQMPDVLQKAERTSLEEKQRQIKESFGKKKGGK